MNSSVVSSATDRIDVCRLLRAGRAIFAAFSFRFGSARAGRGGEGGGGVTSGARRSRRATGKNIVPDGWFGAAAPAAAVYTVQVMYCAIISVNLSFPTFPKTGGRPVSPVRNIIFEI